MDGLSRTFVDATALTDSVYHTQTRLSRDGLEDLKQFALLYPVEERIPGDVNPYALDTVVTRLDECAHAEGTQVDMAIAFTGSELELLQHVVRDAGRAPALDFVAALCESVEPVTAAYGVDVTIHLETYSDLTEAATEEPDDILQVLLDHMSFKTMNYSSGPEPRYKLRLYLSEAEYRALVRRSDPDEMPVGKLCHVLAEKVAEPFNSAVEVAEIANLLATS